MLWEVCPTFVMPGADFQICSKWSLPRQCYTCFLAFFALSFFFSPCAGVYSRQKQAAHFPQFDLVITFTHLCAIQFNVLCLVRTGRSHINLTNHALTSSRNPQEVINRVWIQQMKPWFTLLFLGSSKDHVAMGQNPNRTPSEHPNPH